MDNIVSSEQLAEICNADGEFRIAARYWNGGLRLAMGERTLAIGVRNGVAQACVDAVDGLVTLSAPEEMWAQLTATVPPRFFNDLAPLMEMGMQIEGDLVSYAQYYPAIMRVIELLRPENPQQRTVSEDGATPRFDAPVGRYVHLELGGYDHRIYYETAGEGIPMLLQHTAGCHGLQWRHLFEVPEITRRFQLIAYDLPFHGKSIPPVDKTWWAEEYRLTGELVRSVPVMLKRALGLERPVFMGCSVGGVLALDLAYHHPDEFRAVISLEGSLKIGTQGDEQLAFLWHPQVSNEFKARLMEGLMSPTSPQAYRKETSQVYAAGWPPAFLGDLNYYMKEFDLTDKAHEIDTAAVAVHILSGEYDFSGTMEMGQAAQQTIAGSTYTPMPGLGHFPMSEDPQRFIEFLMPVLDKISG